MIFERKKYKHFALMQLEHRWSVPILATLITILITMLFSFTNPNQNLAVNELLNAMQGSSEELMNYLSNQSSPLPSLPVILLEFIATIVSFILDLALINVFLTLSRSPDKISIKCFFEGLNYWPRAILSGLWMTLWSFLWALVAIPIVLAIIIPFTLLLANSVEMLSVTLKLITPIALLIGFIPLFIRSLAYSMYFYLVAEFPELGITKALRISIKITKGYKWQIFVTGLSFIGWILLSILSFGIGFFWLTPYMQMTTTNVYHALLKNALENQIINPEDLN